MQPIIIFSAILAVAIAAPAPGNYYGAYVPLSKSTLTTSSQTVDHGSTHVLHTPVVAHDVEYHVPLGKTTVTQSNQVVNHGSTAVVHTPVVHAPVVHTPVVHAPVVHTPVVHAPVVHAPVYTSYSAPAIAYKSGDSAITHHSSTVHETVPVVNALPAYSYYH